MRIKINNKLQQKLNHHLQIQKNQMQKKIKHRLKKPKSLDTLL